MFSRLLTNLLGKKGNDYHHSDDYIAAKRESISTFEAVMYRIEGVSAELLRPKSCLKFVDHALDVSDLDSEKADMSLEYDRIYAIRQFRSTTVQFLYRSSTSDSIEYGFHFSSAEEAFKFRAELLSDIEVSLEVLLRCKVSIALFDAEQKIFRPIAESCPMSLARRDSDGLSLLTVINEADDDILFQVELTRDVQFWPSAGAGEFTLWGPFVNNDTQIVRSLLLFKLAQTDTCEVFEILSRVVGYEERLIREELQSYENNASNDIDEDMQMEWDDSEPQSRHGDETPPAEESEPEDELEEELQDLRPRGKRTSIIECQDPSSLIIEKDPDAKLHRFMQCGQNRSFVCRSTAVADGISWKDTNRKADFDLEVYGKDAKGLSNLTKVTGEKFTYNRQNIVPTTGLLHANEGKLLLSDSKERDAVYYMDLETEKIVSKFDTDEMKADMIFNTFKGGAVTSDPTFMCANSRAFYLMDTRLQKGRGHFLTYATNPQFTAAGTDEKGHILLGNKSGQLRLYDGEPNASNKYKIAKTQLNAVEQPIKAVDVSPDGSWILATMKTCLVVYPTKLKKSTKTGFETRLGSNKPPAVYLRLEQSDIMKYGLQDIDFQPAVFDPATHSILTSTGNLAIIWDFKSVKRGLYNKYSIKLMPKYIKDSKALSDGSVVVAYPQDIGVLGQKARRISRTVG